MRRLLAFRASEPALFEAGTYEPLQVTGQRGRGALAFLRRHQGRAMIVVVGRLLADGLRAGNLVPDAEWWGDTEVTGLPPVSDCTPVIGPDWAATSSLPLAEIFAHVPVAVLSLRLT
jgi:(1->4)-alpha-D-glucan 1-alpha-D-glucosylmutase